MIYRHTQEQINEYYNSLGINQSGLKVLLTDGIEKFLATKDTLQRQNDLYYEEKTHFVIGSAVDCIITGGQEEFEKQYFVSKLKKKPGDKTMSVVKLAYDKAKSNFPLGPDADIMLYKREVFEACNEQGYYSNRAKATVEDDTRIGTIVKDNGNGYWVELIVAEGKQLLSGDESYIVDTVSNNITNHRFTKRLFTSDDNTDIIYQIPLYWTFNDILCKGMLDMVIVDHVRKVIMPIDLKTTGFYVTKFNKTIKIRRYDLQGSYYTFGLSQNLKYISAIVGKDISNYRIANFAFIVESTIKPGTPLIFPLTENLLEQGRYGASVNTGNTNDDFKGWEHALEIYKDWESIGFSLEKRVAENNGVIFVDANYEYNINL